ncbi:DUF4340 domain-containing protein [Pseudobacteroides cellulosolvens]|uniref:DUF4340 domain-containing protein n=1 Tax=Pseudobacteroides cellulosolvens ATCC 35603 = DSM 2933 TaxID=398512 RepID=A0A0L6JTZ0_9FIRM|nr:DUF4340 domain-containing protein [Pseudobacteroides cellulosolvens]KNY29145.1 protein of unknown function DUF4340 [Pseudobacteroides cellulosolvens ATCC 35603 = DSM 2933]
MRTFKNVIILAVVMVLLVGALVAVNVFKKEDEESGNVQPTVKLIPLMEAKKDDITEYTIENDGNKFTVTHKGTEWELTYPAGVKYSKIETENMANNAAGISASKIIEENAADLKVYGLDKPTVVSFKTKDGKEQVIEIGSNTPTDESTYVKTKGSNTVYLVDKYSVGAFKISKYFFWKKELFDITKDDIKSFTLERQGKVAFKVRLDDGKQWYLTEPLEGVANSGKLQPCLDGLPNLSATSIEEDKPKDLAEFGLDKPAYVMTLDTKQGTQKLYLGSEVIKGQEIYGKLEGNDTIFVLPLGSLDYLDMPLKDLVEGLIYAPDIYDVTEFTLDMEGKTTNVKLQLDEKKDTDKDKYTVNGKEANKKNSGGEVFVRVFYRALIGIGFVDLETENKTVPALKPEVTITYNIKKAPGQVKIEYIPKDSTTYYAVINGKFTGKIVSKLDFDMPSGVKDSLRKLLESIESK